MATGVRDRLVFKWRSGWVFYDVSPWRCCVMTIQTDGYRLSTDVLEVHFPHAGDRGIAKALGLFEKADELQDVWGLGKALFCIAEHLARWLRNPAAWQRRI